MVWRKYIDTYMCVYNGVHIALQLGIECNTSRHLCCLQAWLHVCGWLAETPTGQMPCLTQYYTEHTNDLEACFQKHIALCHVFLEIAFAEVPSDSDLWVWDMSSITVDSSRRPPHTKFILAILVERLWWLCVGQRNNGFPCYIFLLWFWSHARRCWTYFRVQDLPIIRYHIFLEASWRSRTCLR